MRRITPNPYRNDSETRKYSQVIDGTMEYKVDFFLCTNARSTSVSSVTWEDDGSTDLTIANQALSGDVASADVSATSSGYGSLKVTATMADGSKEVQFIEIEIHDPSWKRYA